MITADKPFLALVARDMMTRDLLVISEDIPMRSAAELLLRHQVSGAPVVDLAGRLVGVISTTDFMRASQKPAQAQQERPVVGCWHQSWTHDSGGKAFALCDLPPGTCSVQRTNPAHQNVCTDPRGVAADWQLTLPEAVSADAVKQFMTRDVVTARAATPIRELARIMLEAGIRRIIIVDERHTPVGVVSSTDIIAAVARQTEE